MAVALLIHKSHAQKTVVLQHDLDFTEGPLLSGQQLLRVLLGAGVGHNSRAALSPSETDGRKNGGQFAIFCTGAMDTREFLLPANMNHSLEQIDASLGDIVTEQVNQRGDTV